MRIKPGVQVEGVKPETLIGMMVADEVWRQYIPGGIVVTSVMEGVHKTGSKHYIGRAFDLRLPVVVDSQVLVEKLREALGEKPAELAGGSWDVVLEADHIHVEFDPKQQQQQPLPV